MLLVTSRSCPLRGARVSETHARPGEQACVSPGPQREGADEHGPGTPPKEDYEPTNSASGPLTPAFLESTVFYHSPSLLELVLLPLLPVPFATGRLAGCPDHSHVGVLAASSQAR